MQSRAAVAASSREQVGELHIAVPDIESGDYVGFDHRVDVHQNADAADRGSAGAFIGGELGLRCCSRLFQAQLYWTSPANADQHDSSQAMDRVITIEPRTDRHPGRRTGCAMSDGGRDQRLPPATSSSSSKSQ